MTLDYYPFAPYVIFESHFVKLYGRFHHQNLGATMLHEYHYTRALLNEHPCGLIHPLQCNFL